MTFRPYPVLTLVAIPLVAFLIWLGQWQFQRAQWKTDLIASYEAMAAAAPQSASDVFCKTASGVSAAGKPVVAADVRTASPTGAAAVFVRMFGHNSQGDPGWRLMAAGPAPACIADQGEMLVEAGFETLDHRTTIYANQPTPPERYVVEIWPSKSMFAPVNAPETNDWHWFDAPAMAMALKAPKLNDRYYLSVVTGLPDELTSVPPVRHIGYAVTWYGMALAFLVIYAVFHIRAGRLSFRKQDADTQ